MGIQQEPCDPDQAILNQNQLENNDQHSLGPTRVAIQLKLHRLIRRQMTCPTLQTRLINRIDLAGIVIDDGSLPLLRIPIFHVSILADGEPDVKVFIR